MHIIPLGHKKCPEVPLLLCRDNRSCKCHHSGCRRQPNGSCLRPYGLSEYDRRLCPRPKGNERGQTALIRAFSEYSYAPLIVLPANDQHHSTTNLNKIAFPRMMECHFAKWRHTVTLLHHCEARSYADYVSRNHRWHIRRLHVVLRAGLCAAIFTTYMSLCSLGFPPAYHPYTYSSSSSTTQPLSI